MTEPVLNIEDLHLRFPVFRGEVHALNHVSLEIGRGEIVGVVGVSDRAVLQVALSWEPML